MKRAFLTILFFMSLLPCIVYAEELFLYISDGQWGYATDDGTVVIAASFSEATPFTMAWPRCVLPYRWIIIL